MIAASASASGAKESWGAPHVQWHPATWELEHVRKLAGWCLREGKESFH